MPLDQDRESLVVDHILESPENLAVAFDVSNAFSAARLTLITRYARALEGELATRLGGDYEVKHGLEWDLTKAGPVVRVRGIRWPEQFDIRLEADSNDATNYFIGLCTDPPTPITSDDTAALNDASPKVTNKPYTYWPWWFWLDDQERYLNTKEGLIRISSSDYVDQITTILERLVRAADSFLLSDPT